MTFDEIVKRTAQRKAAGVNQTYPHHKDGGKKKPPSSIKTTPLPCAFKGDAAGPVGWHYCEHPNPTENPKIPSGDLVCGTGCNGKCTTRCPGYSAIPPIAVTETFKSDYGVVVGSYKWPELIDLQCKLIRETCGEVPILISNDSPENHGKLLAICSAYKDVTLNTNPERIGHTGGDISVFYKGIKWSAERGFKTFAKLSQRFLITKKDWLREVSEDLLKSTLPLATRACRGVSHFKMRSESCVLDVGRWNHPAILQRIQPRRYWNDSPNGLAAETIIYRVLEDLLGCVFWPWGLFTEERRESGKDFLWHDSDSLFRYQELAKRFGIKLSDDFHIHGWQGELKEGKYLHG